MDSSKMKMSRRRRMKLGKKKEKLSDQDKKRLACLMREQPGLWKVSHPKYRKGAETAYAWTVISRKLAQPVIVCQTAWKALKDGLRYRKTVAKEQMLQKRREEGIHIEENADMLIEVDEAQMRLWKFWNVMRFCVDQEEEGGEDHNTFKANDELEGDAQQAEMEERDPLEELGGESEDDNGDGLGLDCIEDRNENETFRLQIAPLVMSYPCVWQSSHPEYRKSAFTAKAWDEISKVLGRSVHVCKTAWKSLKDGLRYYQKVVAKEQSEAIKNVEMDIETIEQAPEQLQSWKFYGVMRFFIEDQLDEPKRSLKKDEISTTTPKPIVGNVEERSCSFEVDFMEADFMEAPFETKAPLEVKVNRKVKNLHVPLSSTRVHVPGPERCLVCYSKDNIVEKADVSPGSILSSHVHTIFILRNILEVPPKQLEYFLKKQGSPDRWVALCHRCSELITKAKTVYEMSLEIFKKYQALKHNVIQRVKSSPNSYKTKINNATDECRKFVKKRKYAPSTDPFVSGDRLAQLKLSTCGNEEFLPDEDYHPEPVIKQEVYDEDDDYESCQQEELIIPDRRLAEKEKVSSKSNEELDMEWSPDPEREKSDMDQSDDEWKPTKKFSSPRNGLKSTSNSKTSGRKLYFKNHKRVRSVAKPQSSKNVKIRSFRCPICYRAYVKYSRGEMLCEHLELCLPDHAAQYSETGLPQLSCPLCENFSRPVENKTEFAEHMAWCRLLKEAKLGLKQKPKEIPLKCRVFQCSICPQKFMKLDAFLRHYLHHKRYIYKCNQCHKKYCALNNVTRHHYTIHHRDMLEAVPITERFTEDRRLPLVHWWCPIPNCSEKFDSDDERDLHYETCHGFESIPEKQHKCNICPKEYLCKDDLRLHQGTMHVTELHLFSCDRCGESFATQEFLKEHRMQKHRLDLFVCHHCGLRLATKSTFQHHLQLHLEKKKNPCTQCDESFPTMEYLRYHIYRKHTEANSDNPLACPICQKILNSKPYLAQHIATVHEKKYKVHCHVCGAGLTGNAHLKRHLSQIHHIGEYGKHRCVVEGCGRVFYQKGLLEMHMSQHRQEPQFDCSFCAKSFYFKCQLKRHELIHKNAESKPYQCEICAKRFPIKSYLHIHMKSHQNK